MPPPPPWPHRPHPVFYSHRALCLSPTCPTYLLLNVAHSLPPAPGLARTGKEKLWEQSTPRFYCRSCAAQFQVIFISELRLRILHLEPFPSPGRGARTWWPGTGHHHFPSCLIGQRESLEASRAGMYFSEERDYELETLHPHGFHPVRGILSTPPDSSETPT